MPSPTNGALADTLLSPNSILILAGLLLLLLNLIVSIPRIRAGKPAATVVNFVLTLLACALLVVGVVRFTFGGTNFNGVKLTDLSTLFSQPMLPLIAAVVGGLIVIIASVIVFRTERNRDTFNPAASNGLLTIGAGIFVLVAAIAIPSIPYQMTVASANRPASAANANVVKSAVVVVQPTQPADTLTPSITPSPLNTATPLPSLTPTGSETPIVLYTQVAYVSTYAQSTPTKCTLTTKTTTYLRGDASEKQSAIGVVSPGSLLYVSGRTANKQWWSVLAPTTVDASTMIEGWVRADFVTADAACTDQEVHALDATETPTRIPSNAGAATVSSPCSLITTAATSLRPNPSRQQTPLAQVPERTALTPLSKSADGAWWQVSYGNQTGWVGAGAVMASASCATVPTQTP